MRCESARCVARVTAARCELVQCQRRPVRAVAPRKRACRGASAGASHGRRAGAAAAWLQSCACPVRRLQRPLSAGCPWRKRAYGWSCAGRVWGAEARLRAWTANGGGREANDQGGSRGGVTRGVHKRVCGQRSRGGGWETHLCELWCGPQNSGRDSRRNVHYSTALTPSLRNKGMWRVAGVDARLAVYTSCFRSAAWAALADATLKLLVYELLWGCMSAQHSSSNPPPCRHTSRCTHSAGVLHLHQIVWEGSEPPAVLP